MVFYEQFFSLPRNPTLEDHKNILQALQQKNATAAIEHMRRHIAVSMEGLGRLKD
jgi:DNA-binding GntR family transcriptional regulator